MEKFEYQKHWTMFISGTLAVNCKTEDDSNAFITMCSTNNLKTICSSWHIFGTLTAYICNQRIKKICINNINLLDHLNQVEFEKTSNESYQTYDECSYDDQTNNCVEDDDIQAEVYAWSEPNYTTIKLPKLYSESNCITDSKNNLLLMVEIEFESMYQNMDSKIQNTFFNKLKTRLIDEIISESKFNNLNDINNIRIIEAKDIEYFYNTINYIKK